MWFVIVEYTRYRKGSCFKSAFPMLLVIFVFASVSLKLRFVLSLPTLLTQVQLSLVSGSICIGNLCWPCELVIRKCSLDHCTISKKKLTFSLFHSLLIIALIREILIRVMIDTFPMPAPSVWIDRTLISLNFIIDVHLADALSLGQWFAYRFNYDCSREAIMRSPMGYFGCGWYLLICMVMFFAFF